MKKKAQNGKRRKKAAGVPAPSEAPLPTPAAAPVQEPTAAGAPAPTPVSSAAEAPAPVGAPAPAEETTFDPEIVEHIRMVTSLVEGRRVRREEVIALLSRLVSQHRIASASELGEDLRRRLQGGP